MISAITSIGIGMICSGVILFVIGVVTYVHEKKTENGSSVDMAISLLSIASIILCFGVALLFLGLVLPFFEKLFI